MPSGWLWLWLLAAAAGGGGALAQVDTYCDITPSHTLCQFSGASLANCGDIVQSGVPPRARDLVIRLHNERRSRVAMGRELQGAPGPQPAAANMRQVEWDAELASIAQRWAEQCTFRHDCGQCRRVPRFSVGQNLFASISTGGDGVQPAEWERAINSWYDEVKDFAYSDVDQFPSTRVMIGHYTAMVWGHTYLVGCGFVNYRTFGRDNRIYVCNYGPGGNIISYPVYERGAPCSACPAGTSCSLTYQGLCTASTAGGAETPPPTMPPLTMPPLTMPSLTMPPMTMPPLTMPPLTMPPLTMPPLTMPPTSMPTVPDTSGSVTSELPPLNVFTIRPDPASGCFAFAGYIFCSKSRESLVVIKIPKVP